MTVVELEVHGGRALVAGVPLVDGPGGRLWGLPPQLVADLQEWAAVAARSPAPEPAALHHRGRQLAARLSVVLRVPVDLLDPVDGSRVPLREVTRATRVPAVPPLASVTPRPQALAVEPTPWATGLALSALLAGLVCLTDLGLVTPMIGGLGGFAVVVNLVVVGGLVPALWLNRAARTWRWAVYGTLAGLAVALPIVAVLALNPGGS